MHKPVLEKIIGIVGGGQLGRMMLFEAKRMGFRAAVLDPAEDCPCHALADWHIVADFEDSAAIRRLAEISDVVTYEFEHINAAALADLENEGFMVYPTARSLTVIQDKLTQKRALAAAGIPVPDFVDAPDGNALCRAGESFGYPFIAKSRRGGYDGKGNCVVHSPQEIPTALTALGGERMAERMVDFWLECSVIACRGIDGTVGVYPVGENEHVDNILRRTIVPAHIPQEVSDRAMAVAREVMEAFEGVGIFCVELFVTENGEILVNEVAPRPHNSGHYTIEGCWTSQFEQHIRAIAGLPLGEIGFCGAAVMENLLGEEGESGPVQVLGLEEASALPAKVHIYGKPDVKPLRKMGHITSARIPLEDAMEACAAAHRLVRIVAKNT